MSQHRKDRSIESFEFRSYPFNKVESGNLLFMLGFIMGFIPFIIVFILKTAQVKTIIFCVAYIKTNFD